MSRSSLHFFSGCKNSSHFWIYGMYQSNSQPQLSQRFSGGNLWFLSTQFIQSDSAICFSSWYGCFFSFRHASRQNHRSSTIGLTSQWRRHTFFCGKLFTCWSDQESGCHFFPTRCFVYSVVLSLFQFPSLFIDILLASVRKWRNYWILSLSSAHKSCRQFQVWKLCRQVIFLLKYRKSTLIIHHPNLVICYIANK